MKLRVTLLLSCFLIACHGPVPSSSLYAPSPTPVSNVTGSRTFRVRVTLSKVSDLRVKAGERVLEGDMLVDRSNLRKRLTAHIGSLKEGRRHLWNQMVLTDKALKELRDFGAELPLKAFEVEKLGIRKAELQAERALKQRKVQEQILWREQWVGLGAEQLRLVKIHEGVLLEEARSAELMAIQEVNSGMARLRDQEEGYQYESRKHKSEFLRQELVYFSQREQTFVSLAHLDSQILDSQLRLDQTTEVRAPFAGMVKRIDWEEMSDERIIVVIFLSDVPG